jgi:hypothetical protein
MALNKKKLYSQNHEQPPGSSDLDFIEPSAFDEKTGRQEPVAEISSARLILVLSGLWVVNLHLSRVRHDLYQN